MRAFYEGRVAVLHEQYAFFRKVLYSIPERKRAAKFKMTLIDMFGCRATVKYDAVEDAFYEKASRRHVVDASAISFVPISDLGHAMATGDATVFHETMDRVVASTRSVKRRPHREAAVHH